MLRMRYLSHHDRSGDSIFIKRTLRNEVAESLLVAEHKSSVWVLKNGTADPFETGERLLGVHAVIGGHHR